MATCARRMEEAIELSFRKLSTGHERIKEKQKRVVMEVLCGKDVFVCLPTGYGKTVITAVLPGAFDRVNKEEQRFMVLCISPLISLMIDQRRQLLVQCRHIQLH